MKKNICTRFERPPYVKESLIIVLFATHTLKSVSMMVDYGDIKSHLTLNQYALNFALKRQTRRSSLIERKCSLFYLYVDSTYLHDYMSYQNANN